MRQLNFYLAFVLLFVTCVTSCTKKNLRPTKQEDSERIFLIIDHENNVTPPIKELLHLSELEEKQQLGEVVALTQRSWIRSVERSRLVEEHENVRAHMLKQFSELGLVDEVRPSRKHYDYVILLGARYEVVRERLQFLEELMRDGLTFSKIALLGSHRPLESVREITPMLSMQIFSTLPLTEIDMMSALVEKSPQISKITDDMIIRIASPMKTKEDGSVVRANTLDTVEDFSQLNVRAGTALVISSQPFVLRQDLVVRSRLTPPWNIETVGPAAPITFPTDVYLDELARTLYEINSR